MSFGNPLSYALERWMLNIIVFHLAEKVLGTGGECRPYFAVYRLMTKRS
jgi:hypothetical protein